MIHRDSLEYLYSLKENVVREKHGRGCYTAIPLAIEEITLDNYDSAEFGVWTGESARLLMASLTNKKLIHLFDSFEGLPEDWLMCPKDTFHKKGYFKLEDSEQPKFYDRRVKLHVGMFADTVPQFVEAHEDPLAYIHMDCNLYSSTKTILNNINDLVIEGTIILFEQYYNYNKNYWKDHEYKAFAEYLKRFNRKFKYLGRTDLYQVWVKIIK